MCEWEIRDMERQETEAMHVEERRNKKVRQFK